MRGGKWGILPFVLALALLVYGCGSPDDPTGSEGGGGEDGARYTARNTSGSSASGVGEKVAVAGGSYTRVSPEELRGALRGGDFLLVNTHVPFAGTFPARISPSLTTR